MFTVNKTIKEVHGYTAKTISAGVLTAIEPLVFRALVAEWPVVSAGRRAAHDAADYLRGFNQGLPFTASIGAPEIQGRIFYNEIFSDFNYASRKVDLNDFLDKVLAHSNDNNPPTFYIGSTIVDQWLPGFRAQNDLALNELDPRVGIWMGNRTRIPAHYDLPDNIACNVVGRRRFILFPPEQLANLYPGPLDWAPGGQAISLVDFAAPDFERFPKFREAIANAQMVELDAGDALFIPSMWWHHVEGLESFNVLVNYWWRQSPSYMGAPINVLHHALLSLRDLPVAQRQVWKGIFEHYIFNADEQTNAHIPVSARGSLGDLDETQARQLRALLLNKLNR